MLGLVDGLVHRVAIYLVSTDVDETPQPTGAAVVPHSIEQPLRGHDVVEREARGILERVLHVRAGREVHHAVDVMLGEQSRHGGLVRQVALYEVEVGEGFQAADVGKRGDFIELVETDDCVFRVSDC